MSDHDITETQKGGKKGASLPGKAAIQTHVHATKIRQDGHTFSYRIYLQLKKGCYDLIAKMALWVPSTSQAREKIEGTRAHFTLHVHVPANRAIENNEGTDP